MRATALATASPDPKPYRLVETPLDDRIELFELAGEFDALTAPQLEERLLRAIAGGHREVVIDMTRVTFVDMSTLNAIVRALKSAYQRNGHVVLACGQSPVRRAIDLAGLRRALRVYDDRAGALAALRRPSPRGL